MRNSVLPLETYAAHRVLAIYCIYCQTLEKRSSLPPPIGFAEPEPAGGSVLLVHPPNSSSAATLGAALKPPDAPGTIGVLANELEERPPEEPHPPKSPPREGLGASAALGAAGAAAAVVVSGVLQALEPQTSDPDQFPELIVLVAAGVGAGEGALGWERLNTELDAGAGEGLLGAAAGWEGAERSNRSPMEDVG